MVLYVVLGGVVEFVTIPPFRDAEEGWDSMSSVLVEELALEMMMRNETNRKPWEGLLWGINSKNIIEHFVRLLK